MSSPKVPVPTVAKASVPVTNTVTGLEIRVSDFSIEKRDGGGGFGALMSRTIVFYQILVATDRGRSLGCRSAASGSGGGGDREVEDGVSVTFTVAKSYAQILQLRNELDRCFSGSFFPPLPKSIVSGGGGGTSLDRRNQARALIPALDKLFAACCDQTKLAASPTFLTFFGFKPSGSAAEKSSSATVKMTDGDVEAMFDRSEERKRDLFADEDDDDASKLSDSDSDDLFAAESSKAVDKQVDMFATRELFGQEPTAKTQPEVASDDDDDDDDDDVDMSDLVSKLKALPAASESFPPASKKPPAVVPSNKQESPAKMSDVEMNDDDLQAYISQNLNLGGVSLDFD